MHRLTVHNKIYDIEFKDQFGYRCLFLFMNDSGGVSQNHRVLQGAGRGGAGRGGVGDVDK